MICTSDLVSPPTVTWRTEMTLEGSISTWLEAFNHLRKGFDESLVCGTFEGVLDVLVYVNDIQNHQLR